MAITPFKVIQGYRFLYVELFVTYAIDQSDVVLLVINIQTYTSYLAPFPSYDRLLVTFSLSGGYSASL